MKNKEKLLKLAYGDKCILEYIKIFGPCDISEIANHSHRIALKFTLDRFVEEGYLKKTSENKYIINIERKDIKDFFSL